MPRKAARNCPFGPPLKGRAWLKHQIIGMWLPQDERSHDLPRLLAALMLTCTCVAPHQQSSTYRGLPRRTTPALSAERTTLSAHCLAATEYAPLDPERLDILLIGRDQRVWMQGMTWSEA